LTKSKKKSATDCAFPVSGGQTIVFVARKYRRGRGEEKAKATIQGDDQAK
jgi:hypothetical protein